MMSHYTTAMTSPIKYQHDTSISPTSPPPPQSAIHHVNYDYYHQYSDDNSTYPTCNAGMRTAPPSYSSSYASAPMTSESASLSPVSSAALLADDYNKHKKRFLLQVSILFKYLKKSNQLKLLFQAKAIVAECTRRNRMRDPHYMPLQEAIEIRLKAIVGNTHWNKAQKCLDLFLMKKSHQKQMEDAISYFLLE